MRANAARCAQQGAEPGQLETLAHQLLDHHVDDVGQLVLGLGGLLSRRFNDAGGGASDGLDAKEAAHLFEQALALTVQIETAHFDLRQGWGRQASGDVGDDAGRRLGQLDEVAQTLRRLDEHQDGQAAPQRAPLATGERLFFWGGRVDVGEFARCDLGLEARVGGFVKAAHGACSAKESPSGMRVILFNLYFI